MWRDTAESGKVELIFEMMNELLKEQYGLRVLKAEKSKVGAGSDTWFVTCADGNYVVKYPAQSEINHPEQEPELCEYLLERGIPVCRFLKNREGNYLSTDAEGRLFHVQLFIEGKTYELNTAPSCAGGQLDLPEFSEYVAEYCRYAELNAYDREMLLPLFFYQIAVCDYYGQYFSSDADNRHIYLHQARFSTKLLKWYEENNCQK